MYKLEDLKDRIRENNIAIVRPSDNTVFFKPKDYTLDSKLIGVSGDGDFKETTLRKLFIEKNEKGCKIVCMTKDQNIEPDYMVNGKLICGLETDTEVPYTTKLSKFVSITNKPLMVGLDGNAYAELHNNGICDNLVFKEDAEIRRAELSLYKHMGLFSTSYRGRFVLFEYGTPSFLAVDHNIIYQFDEYGVVQNTIMFGKSINRNTAIPTAVRFKVDNQTFKELHGFNLYDDVSKVTKVYDDYKLKENPIEIHLADCEYQDELEYKLDLDIKIIAVNKFIINVKYKGMSILEKEYVSFRLAESLKSDLSDVVRTIGADKYALGDLLNGQVI